MARIPDELIERIKSEVKLSELCEDRGIALAGKGKNLRGCCPFHDDEEPSFVVTPSKNLWNCLAGCGGGTVIDLVMKLDGLNFPKAVDKLGQRIGAVKEVPKLVTKNGTEFECIIDPADAVGLTNETLMKAVCDYYHETFLNVPNAMQYLQKRKCFHPEAAKLFNIGYSNKTLNYRIPRASTTALGRQLRAQLTQTGVLRHTGHEHHAGAVIFPICDRAGQVVQLYSRKIGRDSSYKKSNPLHLYSEGPKAGIWNLSGIENQKEWIICESIIDALTLWCGGFRNVTATFGSAGMNEDLVELLTVAKPERVVIAYDHDEAGDKGAEDLAHRFASQGASVYRAQLPKGYDVNQVAMESPDISKALAALLEGAPLMIEGVGLAEQPSYLVAETAQPEPPVPVNKADLEPVSVGEDELHFDISDRLYRVRGLGKNLSFESLRVQLRCAFGDRFHLDTLDLCAHKQRESFIKAASAETTVNPDILKRDIGRVLMALEVRQEQQIKEAEQPKENGPKELESGDKEEALEFLRDPRLIERLLEDFESAGVVGEDTNKLVGYLGATSRLFDKPLGIIVQSTSAAGKTTLMEAVLAFIPSEERVKYSALTGQALFYLGEANIKHKILAIAEEEGAERATYALKLLQSEGELTIASTGKDANTGRHTTEEYHVEGPAMIFFTTTNIEIDEELANRCLTLTVDESREQTRRIHQLQREARTEEGIKRKAKRKAVQSLHQNAQRLLEPVAILNPYAHLLTFPDENTRLRRDQEKYLTLIDTIALLHQHQREVIELDGVRTIRVTLEDIELANRLSGEVLGRSLDEMPPQTRRFLTLLDSLAAERCEAQQIQRNQWLFTQREIREATGWSSFQVKKHLGKLAELEYVIIHRGTRGYSFTYELIYQGEGNNGKPFLQGLIDVEKLKSLNSDADREHPRSDRLPPGSPQVAPRLQGGSTPENPAQPSDDGASSESEAA